MSYVEDLPGVVRVRLGLKTAAYLENEALKRSIKALENEALELCFNMYFVSLQTGLHCLNRPLSSRLCGAVTSASIEAPKISPKLAISLGCANSTA